MQRKNTKRRVHGVVGTAHAKALKLLRIEGEPVKVTKIILVVR